MQMYPSGGYPQHCYTSVPDDEDNYSDCNDYHYNAFGHQSMPMMIEKGILHHNMQKMLDKGVPHPKQNYMWDNNYGDDGHQYKGGSTMEMKPNHQWKAPQNMQGGYNQNFNNFKPGHEDYNEVQYTEEWSESKEEYDTWTGSNDNFGLNHENTYKRSYSGRPYGGSAGYGAQYRGPHIKCPCHKPMARSLWCARSIKD